MYKVIRNFQSEPVIRIFLTGGKDLLDFRTFGEFQLMNNLGEKITDRFTSDLKWRIRVDSYEPAQFIYTHRVAQLRDRANAERLVEQLFSRGYEARIEDCGGLVHLNGRLLTDNTEYRVLIGEFNTFEDARYFRSQINDAFHSEIIRERIRDARGILEIFDEEYENTHKVNNCLKLIPSNTKTETILYEFRESQQGDKKFCLYKWPISFQIGDYGGIVAICEIALETYLKEIVHIVIEGQYPFEAVKSLTVASRSWILYNLGLQHTDIQYDFCSTEHCQLFQGSVQYGELIEKAIEKTRGEVLLFDEKLCETPHTYHCGGHTECKSNRPYLQGIFDGQNGYTDKITLSHEKGAKDWITSQPGVYCSMEHFKGTEWKKQFNAAFRWEVSYSRQRIEKIIRKKTGEDIGILFDIIPIKRGISGRLLEIELLGSKKNMKIKGDQPIRQTLSESLLKSSCFIIEIEMGDDGIPISFSFVGAGSGHGIGLCQIGAIAMALQGKNYEDILHHYYQDVQLRKIY